LASTDNPLLPAAADPSRGLVWGAFG
jgi:hypothetical protein